MLQFLPLGLILGLTSEQSLGLFLAPFERFRCAFGFAEEPWLLWEQ
jgi:hypothetical protein